MLKQENKKLEEEQIKDCINNRNKAIDGSERKFISSLLNRDKKTIVMNRARSLDPDGNEILLTTPGEVKNEATNIFSNQFRKQKHKFNEPLPSHWEQEYLPKDNIDSNIYNSLDNPLTLQEWMDVVKNSNNKSTAGISGVRYQMIKHASKKVHELLTQLANLCFSA